MADDDDDKRKAFEEARREFNEGPSEELKPKPSSAAKPSLRVVPASVPSEPWQRSDWLPTGENVVLEFMRKHGEKFYYVDPEAAMYRWDGHVWGRDDCRSVPRLMGELCRLIAAGKKKGHRNKLETTSFITGASGRIRDEVAGPLTAFDQAEVLNTTTARVPMNCAALEPQLPRREDYCTKITSVAWVKAPCPKWLAFLDRITEGDAELRDYLQRIAGYCASPFTNEQAFFFFYGSGGNGKGTFLRVLKRVLGSYAATASLDLFLQTKWDQHPEELAGLRAVRLVIATETEQDRHWNESKIKALTGGDPIRARFMRQNSFEYIPRFKIIVSGNHQPPIQSVDPAICRRLQIVPFLVAIPKSEQDGTLEDRLIAAEGPMILNWMLEGFEQWRQYGLAPPDKVISTSEEYFEEQDLMAQWVAECCDTSDPNAVTLSTALFASWKIFAKNASEREGSLKSFVSELRRRGFDHAHRHHGNGFYGIKLKPTQWPHSDDHLI